MLPITEFQGRYRFLSNFWPSKVHLNGLAFPTVEHAYQAAKSSDMTYQRNIQCCSTPGAAKRMGKGAVLRKGWDEIKVTIMKGLVREKFQDEMLKAHLIATGYRLIIEGNQWGDTFWGESPLGHGENHLGRILMEIRDELQHDR